MSASLYIQFFIVGLLGAFIHALMKVNSIKDKAQKANVAFKASDYFKEDWVSHCISMSTITLVLFFVTDILHLKPEALYYLKFSFAFVGYAGNDLASRVFGVVNKRVNDIIDKKTTDSDVLNKVTEPTPHK